MPAGQADFDRISRDQTVALRCVEFLQAELDCIRWPRVLADFGPGGVSERTGGEHGEQVPQAWDGPADPADVGAGVEFAHQSFQNTGGQFGAAEPGQGRAEGGVQAGEGVLAGAVEVGVCAEQDRRDRLGERVPRGQGFGRGVLGADLLAQQLGQFGGLGAGPAVVDLPVGGVVGVATYGFMIDKMLSMPLRARW